MEKSGVSPKWPCLDSVRCNVDRRSANNLLRGILFARMANLAFYAPPKLMLAMCGGASARG
ncbi:MAG: hypothetical protein KGJ75_02825 [Alphaproteobacteria bacterium]|nr:hypothetical protein [Alphaproteobacteria bacterium]MDE2011837.1 hypothetical protein [Alphaproteobacteria bacterium]MDE2072347.1 hypothetical protein [Alphaproteobacteria bacterium]MDE2351571.1 hypothetical protein [Alphaproteobacteria bacterium]